MNDLQNALQDCLKTIEDGRNLDEALARYPRFEHELSSLLQVVSQSRSASLMEVPDDVRRRVRARLLERAVKMRASNRNPSRRINLFQSFPRLAIAMVLVVVLALSSTGLVSASSGALPGDRLYSVKRTWENVQLFLVLSPESHDLLASRYEQERLDEIDDLLLARRSEPIIFAGLVVQKQDGQLVISGIPVMLGAATNGPVSGITFGMPVRVSGYTRPNGIVDASEIQILQPGAPLPPLEPSDIEHQPAAGGEEGSSGSSFILTPGSPASMQTTPVPQLSTSGIQLPAIVNESFEYSGVVESMNASTWNINGQQVFLDRAVITGTVTVGSVVRFEGYYSSSGRFEVLTLQVQSPPGQPTHRSKGSGDSGGSGGSGAGGSEGSGSGESEGSP